MFKKTDMRELYPFASCYFCIVRRDLGVPNVVFRLMGISRSSNALCVYSIYHLPHSSSFIPKVRLFVSRLLVQLIVHLIRSDDLLWWSFQAFSILLLLCVRNLSHSGPTVEDRLAFASDVLVDGNRRAVHSVASLPERI
jgi:hypothetical protein